MPASNPVRRASTAERAAERTRQAAQAQLFSATPVRVAKTDKVIVMNQGPQDYANIAMVMFTEKLEEARAASEEAVRKATEALAAEKAKLQVMGNKLQRDWPGTEELTALLTTVGAWLDRKLHFKLSNPDIDGYYGYDEEARKRKEEAKRNAKLDDEARQVLADLEILDDKSAELPNLGRPVHLAYSPEMLEQLAQVKLANAELTRATIERNAINTQYAGKGKLEKKVWAAISWANSTGQVETIDDIRKILEDTINASLHKALPSQAVKLLTGPLFTTNQKEPSHGQEGDSSGTD